MKFQILTFLFQLCFVYFGINSTQVEHSIEMKSDSLKDIVGNHMYDPLYDYSSSDYFLPKKEAQEDLELDDVRKRTYTVKRYRPINYDGYTLDINVDLFKSTVIFFKN